MEKSKGNLESIHMTMCVLQYELGDLMKAFCYMEFYPQYKVAYRGEAKAAMADAIAQLDLICEREGWDFNELRELGDERFLHSDEIDRRESKVGK
jgi:hypothetical protein